MSRNIIRPSWDSYFLENIIPAVASRSTCPVAQVGAAIVNSKAHSILTTGYNGSPRGTQHCGPGCYERKMGENSQVCKAVHAEMNAILQAAYSGIRLKGSTIYINFSPCMNCARSIIQAGIKRVVFLEFSPYRESMDLLYEAGVDWN